MAGDTGEQQQGSAAWAPWMAMALVALLLAAMGGYFSVDAFRKARARAELAEAEALKAHERAKAAELAHKALEEKLAKLNAERERLSSERDQLTQAVQERDAELARLKATYADLEEKMKAEIAEGEIRLSQAEGRIQVELVDKILFDSGDASLSKRGSEVLTRLGAVLVGVEGRTIQVSGHTDDSPPSARLSATFPTNWELSVARAVNVVRFLQEKTSVPARRLVAAGYGDTHPVASNATPKGRARNRRIELLLIPELASAKAAELTQTTQPAAKEAESSARKTAKQGSR